MNNYSNTIDTDIGIGSILSNFDTAYIMHTVQDSLNMKFRPFSEPMPNYVDILERQFNSILDHAVDYKEKINETRVETYQEIIQCICGYYGLVFTTPFEEIPPQELFGIAHTIYDVFVSRFTMYMIDFYIRYIINNTDSICAYLNNDPDVRKIKDKENVYRGYIDPKFLLIHQNLNKVVLNMTTYDIPLNVLFSYFFDSSYSDRMSQLFEDTGDIYKNHYAIYLLDQRYMADVLTVIKLELQAATQRNHFQITAPEEPAEEEPSNA